MDYEKSNRVKYRWEFLSRNEEFEEYREKEKKGTRFEAPDPIKQLLFHWTIFRPWIKMTEDAKSDSEKDLRLKIKEVLTGIPSIEVIHDAEKEDPVTVRLNYSEMHKNYLDLIENLRKEYPKHFKKYGRFLLSINALSQEGDTITIKIHLDRQTTEIMADVGSLLAILKKEAKSIGLDFGKHKNRPPKKIGSKTMTIWDTYDLYLLVWDLIDIDGMELTDVAKRIFPKDFVDPLTLTEDDPIPNPESAIKKVIHYYNKAQEMIDGGWRKI